MDLTSGNLFWPHRYPDAADHPPLDQDIRCDLAIIGGGITGALLADQLTQRGLDVVLLDRRRIGQGSTSASTGLLMYDLDTPLHQLIELVGLDHAQRAYRLCFQALADIEQLVDGLGESCDLKQRPLLYLASRQADLPDLQREYAARRAAGFQVELLTRDDILATYRFDRPGALWGPRALDIDPYRFTQLLLKRAAAHGLRVFSQTDVIKYSSDSSGVTIHTSPGVNSYPPERSQPEMSLGPTVRAWRVAFATGYETPEFLKDKVCKLHSTWAVATQPLSDVPGWKDRCLMWEAARPYFYLRSTPDGRALIGGEDERFKNATLRDALTDRKVAKILRTFQSLFPTVETRAEYAWAGTFAETKDGMPYIGQHPKWPNAFFALGYGGNGITFSVLAARILADLATGKRNDDAEVFRFGR